MNLFHSMTIDGMLNKDLFNTTPYPSHTLLQRHAFEPKFMLFFNKKTKPNLKAYHDASIF